MPDDRRNRRDRDRQRNKERDRERERDGKKIILAKKENPVGATILKKETSSSSSQPKILLKQKESDTKLNSTREIHSKEKSTEPSSDANTSIQSHDSNTLMEVPLMSKPLQLLTAEMVLNPETLSSYVQESNNDFLVIAIVGPQNSGKSTMSNILINKNCNLQKLFDSEEIKFPIRSRKHKLQLNPVTEGIEMYITEDRTIVLDCTPLLANSLYKDYIFSEVDDLKILTFLLNICNLLIVVQENYINTNCIRLLNCAELMRNTTDDDCSKIMLVQNKVNLDQLEEKYVERMKKMYKTAFNKSRLNCSVLRSDNEDEESASENVNFIPFPDFTKLNPEKSSDVSLMKRSINQLRYRALMTKRYETCYNQTIQFNEKMWLQMASKAWDSFNNSYFFKKYNNLKEKFNLLNHVSINDGMKYDKNMYYPDD